jgi:predicted lipid-binding transport protein (Tim44 family)
MWGSWFGITVGGLLVVLLIIAIAFGTSALLIPVLLAAFAIVVLGGLYVLKAGSASRPIDRSVEPDPVHDAAPASGEGTPPQMNPRP